jgi:hypothetical protein
MPAFRCTQCGEILELPDWADGEGRHHNLKMDDHDNRGCGPLTAIEPDDDSDET